MKVLIWMWFFSHSLCRDPVIFYLQLSLVGVVKGRRKGLCRANLNCTTWNPTGNLYLEADPLRRPLLESLKQLFLNKCVAPLNFLLLGCSGAWSKVWTKLLLGQTNSCLVQGGGTGGTHSPSPHPAVPLHLRPHPLTPPLFYVHFNFLPPLSSQLKEEQNT